MSFWAHKHVDSRASARRATDAGPNGSSAMKRLLSIALLAVIPAIVSAQTQTKERSSSDQPVRSESNVVRDRVVGPKASNHADSQKSQLLQTGNAPSAAQKDAQSSQPLWGNTSVIVRPEQPARGTVSEKSTSADESKTPRKLVQPTMLVADKSALASSPRVVASTSSTSGSFTYKVGAGDVLDIRLPNTPAHESTLFTVLKNGTVEYPLVNGAISVEGLTPDEIGRLLASQIKVLRTAKVNVSVRDYESHGIVLSGLVDSPGRKALRREAMPVYALLAEASVRPEATTLTIVHNGKEGPPLALRDEQAMATLVFSGDIVRISSITATSQYVYVGGDLASPGEKSFRQGMTLTQALLSAGGTSATVKTVKVSRRNSNGFLSTNEYDLRLIEQGKMPDPSIEAGDRIEVVRGT
ncbi:MAG TPA: polysaccharide biosynthesis/export family protein [Pyrinomonadaceae bacterium]|nr:polysaccharide biosynthesis/export family protein [Pyrinomonadaceae bacterium]